MQLASRLFAGWLEEGPSEEAPVERGSPALEEGAF